MASTVTARAPAFADGVAVSGSELRAAVLGSLWSSAGLINGLRPTQITTPAMQIRVPAGRCVVADGAGGMLVLELAAQTDLDIAASSPTQPRIDSLIAEFVDNGGSSLYRFRIITGTPAGTPSAPSLPPADQPTGKTLRIANISVVANDTQITNAEITLQTGMAVSNAFNSLAVIASDGARPSEASAGTMRLRSDKGSLDILGPNGSTWYEILLSGLGPALSSWTPSVTATTTNPGLGSGSTRNGYYIRIGRLIIANANVKFGSSGVTAGSGTYRVSLPVTAKTLTTGGHFGSGEAFDDSANDVHDIVARINSSTGWSTAELLNEGTLWTSSSPYGFQNNDTLAFTIAYEAAS